MQFKKGDRVRGVENSQVNGVTYGKEYEVLEVDGPGFVKIIRDGEKGEGWVMCSRFELVSKQSELEKLVEQANAGLEALGKLFNRQDEIEAYDEEDGKAVTVDEPIPVFYERVAAGFFRSDGTGYKYRVKPRPTFTPFTTSEGYKVELSTSRGSVWLSIGCQRGIDPAPLKHDLDLVLNHGATGPLQIGNLEGRPTRMGITTTQGKLTWDDVEKIVTALKKAGY